MTAIWTSLRLNPGLRCERPVAQPPYYDILQQSNARSIWFSCLFIILCIICGCHDKEYKFETSIPDLSVINKNFRKEKLYIYNYNYCYYLSRMKMHQWNHVYKIARAHSAAGIVLQVVCTSCEIYWYTYVETIRPNWHSSLPSHRTSFFRKLLTIWASDTNTGCFCHNFNTLN